MDGKEYVVEFDFLGKDSIRYYNKVPVEKQVFKNLKLFMENKDPGDDLFDRLTVSSHTNYGGPACPCNYECMSAMTYCISLKSHCTSNYCCVTNLISLLFFLFRLPC